MEGITEVQGKTKRPPPRGRGGGRFTPTLTAMRLFGGQVLAVATFYAGRARIRVERVQSCSEES